MPRHTWKDIFNSHRKELLGRPWYALSPVPIGLFLPGMKVPIFSLALYKKNASYFPAVFHFSLIIKLIPDWWFLGLKDVFILCVEFLQGKVGREDETDSYVAQAGKLLNSYLSLPTAGIRGMLLHTVQPWAGRRELRSLSFLQNGCCYLHYLKDVSATNIRKRKYLWGCSLQVSGLLPNLFFCTHIHAHIHTHRHSLSERERDTHTNSVSVIFAIRSDLCLL